VACVPAWPNKKNEKDVEKMSIGLMKEKQQREENKEFNQIVQILESEMIEGSFDFNTMQRLKIKIFPILIK